MEKLSKLVKNHFYHVFYLLLGYLLLCSILYLLGYWHNFKFNILPFVGLWDVVKFSAEAFVYFVLMMTVGVFIGIFMGVFMLDGNREREALLSTKREKNKLYTLSVLSSLLFMLLAYYSWSILALVFSVALTAISILAAHKILSLHDNKKLKLRSLMLYLFFILAVYPPYYMYANGNYSAWMIKANKEYLYSDFNIDQRKYPLKYLGSFDKNYFFIDHNNEFIYVKFSPDIVVLHRHAYIYSLRDYVVGL